MIGSNHVKRIHPICTQAEPYVPWIIVKFPLIHSVDRPPIRTISGVPEHFIFPTPFFVPPHQLCCICVRKQPLHAKKYREIPSNLYRASFGPTTIITCCAILVPWSFALWACVQVFIFISTVQYAIVGTRMDFFNFEVEWADHLLGLVCHPW